MNIYRFIQSKSVQEHLEKINYIFSSLEMAYIIWQCPDATLAERFDAWQEIIDTMPDTPLPDSMELKEMEGVHEFLRQYVKLQQEFLDEFNGEEDGVYFYRYIVRELPNKSWPWEYITIENFDHAFLIDPSKYESSMVSLIMEMVNQILIEVFSAVAQWETEKRAKRQREGIEAMKKRGEWERYGRPRKLEKEAFLQLYEKYKDTPGWEASVCEEAHISLATLKRYMREYVP